MGVDVVALCSLPPIVSPKRRTGQQAFVQSTLCIKYGIWGAAGKKQTYWALKSPRNEGKSSVAVGRLTRAQMRELRDKDYDDRVQIIKAGQCELFRFCQCQLLY